MLDFLFGKSTKTISGSAPPLPTMHTRAATLTLRPYQEEGVRFLQGGSQRRMLTDAPGLGKTLMATEAAVLPCVVTCPLYLVEQWSEFLRIQYPNDLVHVAAYGDIIKRTEGIKAFSEQGGWLIVNHDAWRRLYIPTAATVIADEVHHFRNRDAQRSKGFKAYATLTSRVIGLTATPVYKDIGDLWHLLNILDPKAFSSYWRFIDRIAVVADWGYGNQIVRMRDPKLLDKILEPYFLGRTYRDVGMQLPQRIDKHITLNMPKPDQVVYNKLRDFYRLEVEGEPDKIFWNAGAALHELRKLTVTKEKLDTVVDLAEYAHKSTRAPVVIFVWYRETAHRVADYLNAKLGHGKPCAVAVTGEDKPVERRRLATSGPTYRVLTQQSVSEGVDASDARTVLYVEETYVPGQQYQALSRVIRKRHNDDPTPVVVYWLRYLKTVDSVVHNTARSRLTGNALTVLREALL
jgi:superfamily II DNA or RNA helicase